MKKEVIAHKDPKSPISEVFRTLRTNIQFMNVNKKLKVLLVTSTFPGEGKSWTASNLAVTFAQAGKRVVLIDGTKNYSVNLSDIIDIILEQNSFYLVVKNKNPYKITGNFNFKYFNITTANIKPFICDQIYTIVKTINLLLKQ